MLEIIPEDNSKFDKQDKSDFFRVYENVKNGIIKLEDLLFTDMIMVQIMMQEEEKLLNDKETDIENKIKNLNEERDMLKKEKEYYVHKI